MKTLLFPTDFSANASHAVEYGYNLAKHIKANIVICNAVVVPAEMPQTGMIVWPTDEYDILMDESSSELRQLRSKLESPDAKLSFKPDITIKNRPGTVISVVNDLILSQNIDLVVIGQHSNAGLSEFILGNHSQRLINEVNKPLLFVPRCAAIKPVNKIAFATDFKNPAGDIEYIYQLIPLAKTLNAKILLTHVCEEKFESQDFQVRVNNLINEISKKADFPDIVYQAIRNNNPVNGLIWVCEHGEADILAMVHRHHSILDMLISGSHTHKLTKHSCIPMLVFPSNQ